MKIISAIDYGDRSVIRVCMNPDDPEWIHLVGDQVRGSDRLPTFGPDGAALLITSSVVPSGETGETCPNCRYNWAVKEFIFDGPDRDGQTVDELWERVCLLSREEPAPKVIGGLVGRSD